MSYLENLPPLNLPPQDIPFLTLNGVLVLFAKLSELEARFADHALHQIQRSEEEYDKIYKVVYLEIKTSILEKYGK